LLLQVVTDLLMHNGLLNAVQRFLGFG
jgi:hypothetical protein